MKINKNVFFCIVMLTSTTYTMTQYIYPARKSSSPYAFTVYKNKQVIDNTNFVGSYTGYPDYNKCVNICYNTIDKCKSIEVHMVTNVSFTCRIFNNDFPVTQYAKGFIFIKAKPPNCSLSCSVTFYPCGKCECKPSCAARNRRQYICNCTKAAGLAKSCQEHYDRGFNKTGLFQIYPNGLAFETFCEMEKVKRENPIVNLPCSLQPNLQLTFYSYYATNTFSVSYCVISCAALNFNNMFYYNTGCFCGNIIDEIDDYHPEYNYAYIYTQTDYCYIGRDYTDCTLTRLYYRHAVQIDTTYNIQAPSPTTCVNLCQTYRQSNPTNNGYISSGVAENNGDCKCLYGFHGQTANIKNGCSYFQTISAPILPSVGEVWLPMMTRFASWESTFWDRSYEDYENGFGLVNQQWIGLKKLNQITSTFITDMRVDYFFIEDIVFSTMYYNVRFGSSVEKYVLNYDRYDPRGTGEADRFQGDGTIFNSCSKWWTNNDKTCYTNMFPTSINGISYGLLDNLVSIQFYLQTKELKSRPTKMRVMEQIILRGLLESHYFRRFDEEKLFSYCLKRGCISAKQKFRQSM
nr:uncharacterized protein LOC105846181 isoform X2 [Hydra vulgaris]